MSDQNIRIVLSGDASGLAGAAGQAGRALDALGRTAETNGRRVTASAQAATLSMRQISPQITDIVTQLQGGQNPFTVLIQQGGQLKDMAGGIGPLFRSLASTITPVGLALGSVAAVGGTVALAFYQGSKEASALRDSLALTGNFAGVTAGSFNSLAERVAVSTGATVASAREIGAGLVASGRFGTVALESVSTAAQRVAQVSGASAKDVVADFTDMANGATEWASKHNQAWHFATAAQLEYIRQLEESGQQQRAFAEVGRLVTEHLQGQSTQLGYLERAYNSVASAASSFWDAAKGWGRGDSDTPEARLKALREQLDGIRRAYPKGIAGSWAEDSMAVVQGRIDTANRDLLRKGEATATVAAAQQAEQDAIKRREALRAVTDRLSGASSEYAKSIKAIQDAAAAGDIDEKQRLQLLTEAATKYGSGVKGPKVITPDEAERKYRAEVEKILSNRAPRLADIEAKGYEASNRAAQENMARSADQLRQRNDQAAQFGQQLADQAAQISASMITDDRQRGLALIELDRQQAQARLDALAQFGADVGAAQQALNDLVTARQQQLTEQLKPEWMKMLDAWGNTTATMRATWDGAITSMLDGAADQFGRFVSGQGTNLKGLGQQLASQIAAGQFKAMVGQSGLGSLLGDITGSAGGAASSAALTAAATGLTTAGATLGTSGVGLNAAAVALNSAAAALVAAAGAGAAGNVSGSAIAAVLSANGNVFSAHAGVAAYANTIVDQPTVFAFAKGVGLMGEAGPEAVMPLRRTASGRLGVEVAGGGGSAKPTLVLQLNPTIHIDARSDQAQVATTVNEALNQNNAALLRLLKERGVL